VLPETNLNLVARKELGSSGADFGRAVGNERHGGIQSQICNSATVISPIEGIRGAFPVEVKGIICDLFTAKIHW